ncbi:unnamed protein product, partial [Gulo gulo]
TQDLEENLLFADPPYAGLPRAAPVWAPHIQASGSPHPHGRLPFCQNGPAERQLHGSPESLVRSQCPHTLRVLAQWPCPPHIPHPSRTRYSFRWPQEVTHLRILPTGSRLGISRERGWDTTICGSPGPSPGEVNVHPVNVHQMGG